MVRLFNIYYPTRMLVLWAGELLIVGSSFVLAARLRLGDDLWLVLQYEYGFYKILAVTLLALLFLDYFDLYDPQRVPSASETYFRLLVVIGLLSFLLAGIGFLFPGFMIRDNTFVVGLVVLTLTLFGWRWAYTWLLRLPYLRERIYVLGTGDRADCLVRTLRGRSELGMDVVGWSGMAGNSSGTREALADDLVKLVRESRVNRIIVVLGDRRGTMPVRELLALRLSGIKVEDATAILEKITGKIDVGSLYPSWLIFSEGFRLNPTFLLVRRVVSVLASLACLIVFLPLIPFIILAIKLDSAGAATYRQERVGRNGVVFSCYKFRTMRADAEADTGPTWATDDDPRITRVGRVLRYARLDEIPQLYNVLRGDMGFIGPRPERPEFVEKLSREIPYYQLRHIVRPGITGWAQIRYKYGSSVEDALQKLQYDLFYIKNMSLGLDFWIIVQTIKVILLGRGAQ